MERGADFGVPDGEGVMSAATETGRAWPIVSLVVLVALGGINVFLALFIVPKFEQIFQDALPGQRLPGLTEFIMEDQIPLALLAVVWPVGGIVAVWRRYRAAIWIVGIGCVFFFFLIGVTITALFQPMIAIDGGMEAPLTSAEGSR